VKTELTAAGTCPNCGGSRLKACRYYNAVGTRKKGLECVECGTKMKAPRRRRRAFIFGIGS
jgi:hypothetical protein